MARAKGSPKPPGSGRVRGTPNRRTKVATEFAQSFLKDSDFQDAVRNILANPTHPHWQWTVELVMNYAYGKPTENQHITSDGSLPAQQFNIAWVNYDEFFADEAHHPVPLSASPAQLPMADHQGDTRGEERDGDHAPEGWENGMPFGS